MFINMEAKEILENLLQYSGLNKQQFAKAIGVKTKQSIYDIANGKTKSISDSMASKILSYLPSVDKTWLITGEGEMLRPTDYEVSELTEMPRGRVVPVYTLDAVGGFGSTAENEQGVEAIQFFPNAQDGDFAVLVTGNSMAPALPHGCYVLLRPWPLDVDSIEWNATYVIVTQDGASRWLKRVCRDRSTDDPRRVLLESNNPDYPPRKFYLPEATALYRAVSAYTPTL